MGNERRLGAHPQTLEEFLDSLDDKDTRVARDLAIVLRLDDGLRQISSDLKYQAIESFHVPSDPRHFQRPIEWNRDYGFVSEPFGEPLTAVEVLRHYTEAFIPGEGRRAREYFGRLVPSGEIKSSVRDDVLGELHLILGAPVFASELGNSDLLPALRRNYQTTAEACFRGIGKLPVGDKALASKIRKIKLSV